FPQRAGELVQRSPAGLRDLVQILRVERLVARRRLEHVRAPVEHAASGREPRPRLDEVPLELDLQAGLLVRLAQDRRDEVLAILDAAAGRAPDIRWKRMFADQREPVAVEDEQRYVVRS